MKEDSKRDLAFFFYSRDKQMSRVCSDGDGDGDNDVQTKIFLKKGF